MYASISAVTVKKCIYELFAFLRQLRLLRVTSPGTLRLI